MRSGFRIAKIFGINIRIDWSWILIFALISWNLGLAFGQAHPTWTPALQWGIAIVAALLFFASVLAHELAHSLMALQQKLPVRNITLFLFGGVSNIERNPPSPQAEFLITIVGPITSIGLGILFTWLGAWRMGANTFTFNNPTQAIGQIDPVTTLLLWLGPINILLGVFNLIPGFPLDGGRVLRSILWAATDNLKRATRWASGVGQFVAWLFIVMGVAMALGVQIPFFGAGFINGLWLAFIGWFLNSASIQSYQQVLVQDLLEGVPVGRLMRQQPPTVPADSSISDLVHNYVMRSDDHAFPVEDQGHFVGLITLEDMRKVEKADWDATLVRDVMTPAQQLMTARVEEDADEAFRKLSQRDVRQLPVLQDGELTGMLRRRDIMRWLQLQEAS